MIEKGKNGPPKKRLKKRMSKKQAQNTGFSIGIFAIILTLVIFYLYFYVEARILFIFPGLAKKVTFTDLLEEPEAYENEWIKIKGRIQYTFSQSMANTAELIPGYYPTQPGDYNKGSGENYFKIFLEAAGENEDTSFRFSSVDSGNIVELVGVLKGLDKDHKNAMKLKVITVVGYGGVIGWLSFLSIILIAIMGFGVGIFLTRISLGMYPKEDTKP
jgi:hypothetical protein